MPLFQNLPSSCICCPQSTTSQSLLYFRRTFSNTTAVLMLPWQWYANNIWYCQVDSVSANSLLRTCVISKKAAGRPYQTPDPPLLVDVPGDPFEVTWVDFAGTLYVHCSVGEQKVYVCLFACTVSRTTHLEIVSDLILECFFAGIQKIHQQKISKKSHDVYIQLSRRRYRVYCYLYTAV